MNILAVEIVQAGGSLNLDLTSLLILVILLVLFMALKALVFTPFLDDLDQRDVRTEQVRQTADELKIKADSLAEQYQAEIAQAHTQAQEARRVLRVAGLEDKDTRVAAAQKEANAHYESTSASLHSQFEKARTDALSQVDELARQITSKVLGRKV
jgi:F-type H+-transporting ATPase subunit b